MNNQKFMSMIVVVIFVGMSLIPLVSADDPDALDERSGSDKDVPEQLQQDDRNEAGEVKLFFRDTRLTPTRPTGNSSEQVTQCNGLAWRGRFMGTEVGTWSTTITSDATATGSLSISLWARSQVGAKNAGFRINLYRSGGNLQDYFTNRQDLAANPVRFSVDGTYNQAFSAGDTLDVQLIWLSEPTRFIGPSGGGEFLYGNAAFDSQVKIEMQPYPIAIANISVPQTEVTKDKLTIKAEFSDYLGGDATTFFYSVAVSGDGSSTMANIGEPKVSAGGNTSMVSWIWLYDKDNAKSGMYIITVSISYDNNYTVTNSSPSMKIKMGTHGTDDSGNPLASIGNSMNMMIILIVVVIAIVALVVFKKRKKKKQDDEEEDDD